MIEPALRRTFAQTIHFGQTAGAYQDLRRQHPLVPAKVIHRYIKDDHGLPMAQFYCETEVGHQWRYSGSAYDGDDDSFGGEGRCYCCLCGADGDA